jgi:hypothetical protein
MHRVVQAQVASQQRLASLLRQGQVRRVVSRSLELPRQRQHLPPRLRHDLDIQVAERLNDPVCLAARDAPASFGLPDGVAQLIREQCWRLEVKLAQDVVTNDGQGIRLHFIGKKCMQEHTGIHDHDRSSNSWREVR